MSLPGCAASGRRAWADMSPPLALRFAIDDLKAFVLEAALAPGTPVE